MLARCSRQNLNFRIVFHAAVEFVVFFVRYRDAAVGPVFLQVFFADKTPAVFHAVDFNQPARAFALCCRVGFVGFVGVGNTEVFMVAAIGIALIDAVFSFGCFAVAFKLFMPDRLLAQRNGLGFQQPALRVGRHGALAFMHDQSVDNCIFRQRRFAWRSNGCRGTNRRDKPKHRSGDSQKYDCRQADFQPDFHLSDGLTKL